MDKLKNSQKEISDSILDLMCLTFNKKEMQRLLDAYIITNELTNELQLLKSQRELNEKD